jgi:hypothetical protein
VRERGRKGGRERASESGRERERQRVREGGRETERRWEERTAVDAALSY